MDADRAARATAQIQPEQLFMETPPIVFDEWQEVPELWNLVRRAVDDHEGKELYILKGSARPRDNARMHSGADRIGAPPHAADESVRDRILQWTDQP